MGRDDPVRKDPRRRGLGRLVEAARRHLADLRDTRSDLTVLLAIAGLLLVLADRLVIWLLAFASPEWSATVSQVAHGRRIVLIGAPAALLFLGVVLGLDGHRRRRERWEGTGWIYTSPEHPSEVLIAELEGGALHERLRRLRLEIPALPTGFGLDALRELHQWPGRFDLNRWFEVFDRVRCKPGYALDFVYVSWGNAGHPLLYLRKERSRRLASCAEYWQRYGGGQANPVAPGNRALLEHLGFEPSAMGFFQLLLFLREAPRFYQRWHSQADDAEYVWTRSWLAELASAIPEKEGDLRDGISREERAALAALDPRPVVTLMGKTAEVKLLSYTQFGGFSWEHNRVTWPNRVERLRTSVVVTYHRPLHY